MNITLMSSVVVKEIFILNHIKEMLKEYLNFPVKPYEIQSVGILTFVIHLLLCAVKVLMRMKLL